MRFGTAWTRQVFWRAALLYVLITVFQLHSIVTDGAGFSYALDLPYVQMALAQHVAQGTYGINAGETASPVASIAWPFLLVPFAGSRFFCWAPLLLNVIAGLGVCALASSWVDRYFRRGWQQLPEVARWLLALGFVLTANLPALAITGMEHTLQVLVAGGCALAIAEAYFGRRMSGWCLVCAGVAPVIRYEGLAFTLSVCLACWLVGRRKAALVTAISAILPLLLFGAFLRAHGLHFVPLSVITEGRLLHASALQHPYRLRILMAIGSANANAYIHDPQRWPIVVFFLLLCVQAWRTRKARLRRDVLLSALVGLAVLMVLGTYGYFYRLDVAYRFFGFLLAFATVAEFKWFGMWPALAMGGMASAVYVLATVQAPEAAWATAHGQKQEHRFVASFYKGNVLVTDPGWIAFDARDRIYVLSAERFKGMQDIPRRSVLEEHQVRLAMLSPRVPVSLPPGWKSTAVLCRYGNGFNCTTMFHAPELDEHMLRNDLQTFAATLPPGSWLMDQDGKRSDVP